MKRKTLLILTRDFGSVREDLERRKIRGLEYLGDALTEFYDILREHGRYSSEVQRAKLKIDRLFEYLEIRYDTFAYRRVYDSLKQEFGLRNDLSISM